MPPEARGRSFDELARGLASGEVSRLRALKLMGASLLGGVSLGLLGGVAQAQPDCERDCRIRYGNCLTNHAGTNFNCEEEFDRCLRLCPRPKCKAECEHSYELCLNRPLPENVCNRARERCLERCP
jgi:hypothetical protein